MSRSDGAPLSALAKSPRVFSHAMDRRRLVRSLLIAGVLTALVAVFWLAMPAMATAAQPVEGGLTRRDMLLGLLTLAVLSLAAFGFDLRDWF